MILSTAREVTCGYVRPVGQGHQLSADVIKALLLFSQRSSSSSSIVFADEDEGSFEEGETYLLNILHSSSKNKKEQ